MRTGRLHTEDEFFTPPRGGSGLSRRSFLELGLTAAALAATGCGSGGAKKSPHAKSATTTTSVPGPPVPATLREAIRGQVIERGSPGFADAARVYNERFDDVLPSAVAQPLDANDVAGAVRWAVAHDMPFRARSGGHSYAGYSTVANGVVLDLRNLNAISVDTLTGTATIGAGAQLIDVYAGLARRGVTVPAGSCPSVGVGGQAVGGGMGLAGRAFGLMADNIQSARIVTAGGDVRLIDQRSDPELLWALRGGGGGNFGVVTELVFRVHPVPSSAAWFFVSWPWDKASDALAAWQAGAPHAIDSVTSIFHLQTGANQPQVSVAGQLLGSADSLGRLLGPLSAVGGATITSGAQEYLGLQLRWAGCLGAGLQSCHTVGTRPGGTQARASFRAKSDYVSKPLPSAARQLLVAAVQAKQGQRGSGAILFDAYGGAINRVAPDATAFVHRDSLFCIQYLAYDSPAGWLDTTYSGMRPYVAGTAYQNYIDSDLQSWRSAYYGSNYARLVEVQRRVDPSHRFTFPQAVGT